MSTEINVMIDLETMSTESNASIASIGAVKFSIEAGVLDTFYCTVNVANCKQHGLHISTDTVNWWSRQPKEVLKMLRENNLSLQDALSQFSVWYGTKQYPTWGCGSDFDNVIMENAYKSVNMVRPWNAWKNRCYRTIREVIKIPEAPRVGTYHNALDDALHQTDHLLKIFRS